MAKPLARIFPPLATRHRRLAAFTLQGLPPLTPAKEFEGAAAPSALSDCWGFAPP